MVTKILNFKEAVGKKIMLLRLQKDFRSYEMAEKLGIAKATYSNIEKGKTDIKIGILFGLGKILNVSPNYFLENISYK